MDNFEKAFLNFIEYGDCCLEDRVLFKLIRSSFRAGWIAAQNDAEDSIEHRTSEMSVN